MNSFSDFHRQEPSLTETDGKAIGEANTGSSTPDALDREAGLDGLVPYGTRSRNRGGNSRPNYAEDKDYDVDMYDFDRTESKKASRPANATSQGDAARAGTSSRRPTGDDAKAAPSSAPSSSNSSALQNSTSKDQTPGGGSTASLPATQGSGGVAQPSKKRKAAVATPSSSIPSSSSQLTHNGNATAVTKKSGTGPQNSGVQWSETNMLTFCDSQARLRDGHLVADDGTLLAQNGMYYLFLWWRPGPFFFFLVFFFSCRVLPFFSRLHFGGGAKAGWFAPAREGNFLWTGHRKWADD